ncbi:hypothetical protein BGX34_004362 [Mortierella sp. NVP85]|nr:hypothetical protein BGX34_004362 [Mortierella sp. NVP85]
MTKSTIQDQLYQAFTTSTFPVPLVDIQFRRQKNKDAYHVALKTFNNLITPEEFPSAALPLAIVTLSEANNSSIGRVIQDAKNLGLRVSARSGGYQSGYSSNMTAVDDCRQNFVLIDLCKLNRVLVNPQTRIAIAEPGVTGLDLYTETIKYGLHFPGPHIARVTIGGFLLQGGMGIGSRLHGAGVDNVLGFDIVLGSGGTVYADDQTNSDLFFAVRGGGQFLGVVTKFHLRLVPIVEKPALVPTYNETSVAIDQVFAIFDRPQANDLLNFYCSFDPVAPKALENKVIFVVDSATNKKQYLFTSVSVTPFDTSLEVKTAHNMITEWYKTIPTNFATSEPGDYAGIIHGGDASWADSDLSYYAEDVWLPVPLDPRLQQVLIEQWDRVPSNLSSMAVNTGTWDAPKLSALGFDRSYSLCIYSTWKRNGDPTWDAKNKSWLDETIEAIKPWTLGFYANELRPRQPQDNNYWRKCYEDKTFDVLSVAKRRWDPFNVFKSL